MTTTTKEEVKHQHVNAKNKKFNFKNHVCECGFETKSRKKFNKHIGVKEDSMIAVRV